MGRGTSRAFDYLFAFAIATAIVGLWIDIWAHIHRATEASETFLTPWHAIMYGAIGLAGLLLVGLWWSRRRLSESAPPGIIVSFVGVVLFGVGGGADLVWHMLFGVEANLEALLSPTHMTLYVAGFLVFVGPLRMRRLAQVTDTSWPAALPAIVSVVCIVQLAAVVGQFANPVGYPFAASSDVADLSADARALALSFGYLGLIVSTLAATGFVLGFDRYMALPRGTWIVVLGLSTVGVGIAHDQPALAGVGLVAGITAELALGASRAESSSRFRLAAILVPLAWSIAYFGIIQLTDSVWWSAHIVASGLVLPAFIGFVVSVLILPPPSLTRWRT